MEAYYQHEEAAAQDAAGKHKQQQHQQQQQQQEMEMEQWRVEGQSSSRQTRAETAVGADTVGTAAI